MQLSHWQNKNKQNLAPCRTDGRLLLSGFQLLVTLTLDHTAYGRSSLIDLYLRTNFHRNRKKIFWTD